MIAAAITGEVTMLSHVANDDLHPLARKHADTKEKVVYALPMTEWKKCLDCYLVTSSCPEHIAAPCIPFFEMHVIAYEDDATQERT